MIQSDDPRVTGEHVHHIIDDDGIISLIGVVHDHPASIYRVQHVLAEIEPTVLALELPPLAIPLYQRYADTKESPPSKGGEMSAAIQAAGHARVVGIDGPSVRFLGRLGRTLVAERASWGTIKEIGEVLNAATRTAIGARIADVLSTTSSITLDIEQPVDHITSWDDPPERQATDERRQIDRAHAVMHVMEPSRAVRFRDTAREAHMAARLNQLHRGEHVIAIVGRGHLDELVNRLAG